MTLPKLQLLYFNVRGRAEAIRMMLAYGNVPYDNRDLKLEEMASVKRELPFGRLPILTVDGTTVIAETSAITRYIASLTGLMPHSPLEIARADMVMGSIDDVGQLATKIFLEEDESKKQYLTKDFGRHTMIPYLKQLDRMLGKKPFFLGEKPCYADFPITTLMSTCASIFEQGHHINTQENVAALVTRVEGLPGVKEYLAARPHTDIVKHVLTY